MIHHRHVIREAVVALLAAGGTAAGTRVFDHPYDPRQEFPALVVDDVIEVQAANSLPAGADRPIEREYTFEVSAEVQQIAAYARQRDQLLADVERLLAAAGIPGVKSITPAGYAPTSAADGDRPVVVGRQRFRALYYTPQGDPSTPL